MEDYDYCIEEVVENLNYALSYDSDHAGANYLMGKLYMEQFQKYDLAEEYFVASMSTEPENIKTCESYIWLFIRTHRLEEALRLINYTSKLKGVDTSIFLRLRALIYEMKKDFNTSRDLLKQAMMESYNSGYIEFLNGEIERITQKENSVKTINYYVQE